MKDNKEMIDLILSKGFAKKGYGYTRVGKKITHWVTLFEDSLQSYGYYTDDEEFEKTYDSGMTYGITVDQLSTLLDVFALMDNR